MTTPGFGTYIHLAFSIVQTIINLEHYLYNGVRHTHVDKSNLFYKLFNIRFLHVQIGTGAYL